MIQRINSLDDIINVPVQPGGLLEQLRAMAAKRGWSPDTLASLRMEDDDGGSGDDDGANDDTDDEGDDDEGDDDDGASGSKKNVDDPDKKRLSDEAAKHRVRAKQQKERAEKAEAELKKVQDKDKSDVDRLTSENAELLKRAEGAEFTNSELAIKLAILEEAPNHNFNPKRYKAIQRQIDRDGIEVDEDGEVTGIKDALKALAEEYPEWVVSKDDDEGDSKKDKDTSGDRPSGKQTNGSKKSKDGLDKASLESKFPALRR